MNLEQCFLKNQPFPILYIKSHLRLVVDLQTNIKAMQSPAYAHKVKISNLQQMAESVLYIQEHGYDTQNDLKLSMCYSSLLHFDLDQWEEKITDCINYLILLKALVKEEQAYGSH